MLGLSLAALLAASQPSTPVSQPALDLARFQGKVVLVDFWASWCAPCRESFPWMARMQQQYAARGLVVVTVDLDHLQLSQHPALPNSSVVCGDACALPFGDATFDAVTMFDVLEHIPNDAKAASEALRVTRARGWVLLSTPNADWRYPYHAFMRRWCPAEARLMAEWGHVRRGYSRGALAELFGGSAESRSSFINPVTAFFHDISFSRLRRRWRTLLYAAAAPATAVAYAAHRSAMAGMETAFAWRRR